MPYRAPPPPPELLEEQPHLANEVHVSHPLTDPRLGKPPRKYCKAVHERIVEELEKGQRPQGACARAGITLATFYEWVKRGKGGDPWLHEFAEDVEIAYNKAEAQAVDVVRTGVNTDDPEKMNSEDAKWWLERTRSDGFSKQVKTAVEGQIEAFMKRLEAALDPDTFMKVLMVYAGQAPAMIPSTKEVPLLVEHGSSEETDSGELD